MPTDATIGLFRSPSATDRPAGPAAHSWGMKAMAKNTLLHNDAYIVQMLDGYTNGKPSWRKCFVGRHSMIGRATAEVEAEQLREMYPNRQYRVRKQQRR